MNEMDEMDEIAKITILQSKDGVGIEINKTRLAGPKLWDNADWFVEATWIVEYIVPVSDILKALGIVSDKADERRKGG